MYNGVESAKCCWVGVRSCVGVIVVVNFHETGSIRRLKIVLATWEEGWWTGGSRRLD